MDDHLKQYIEPALARDTTLSSTKPDPALAERIFSQLLEEVGLSIQADAPPSGCVLSVGERLIGSDHNTISSQEGSCSHAERSLLSKITTNSLPKGRRVLWVSHEPCLRCAQAIQRFGVDELVFVLENPFSNGGQFLANAGVAVKKQNDWEFAVLERAMDSFVHSPEFCDGRQFPFFLAMWRKHKPLGRVAEIRASFLHHLAPYLVEALVRLPGPLKNGARRQFLSHVDFLVTMTLRECTGFPSVAFVRSLHRALFPPNFRSRIESRDGVIHETASGEWRQHFVSPLYGKFSTPEDIEAKLVVLLDNLNRCKLFSREQALRFRLDFCSIRPFSDGNVRLASILTDVLLLNHGLVPLALDERNAMFSSTLLENMLHTVPLAEQLRLVDSWNNGQIKIVPKSIYDDHPSAFQTYTLRSGNKRYVTDEILFKLDGRKIVEPFVVTDIGAGTGIIADGLLRVLSQRGIRHQYHYLEPSQASIDYFREHLLSAGSSQVHFYAMSGEDFLLPPSDLVLMVQSLQYVRNLGETVHDIVDALNPGGLALIVLSHPDNKWRTMMRPSREGTTYDRLKKFLDKAKVFYEETVVTSPVKISLSDRDTPEGDDLVTFYFNASHRSLSAATKETFWTQLSNVVQNGLIEKKEAFFWIWGGARPEHSSHE